MLVTSTTVVLSLCRITWMRPVARGDRFALDPLHSADAVALRNCPPVSSWMVTLPTSRTTAPAVGEVTAAPARPANAVVLTASAANIATRPRRRTPPRMNGLRIA